MWFRLRLEGCSGHIPTCWIQVVWGPAGHVIACCISCVLKHLNELIMMICHPRWYKLRVNTKNIPVSGGSPDVYLSRGLWASHLLQSGAGLGWVLASSQLYSPREQAETQMQNLQCSKVVFHHAWSLLELLCACTLTLRASWSWTPSHWSFHHCTEHSTALLIIFAASTPAGFSFSFPASWWAVAGESHSKGTPGIPQSLAALPMPPVLPHTQNLGTVQLFCLNWLSIFKIN